MTLLALSIFLLASALAAITILLLMKTNELTNAVANLTTATAQLTTSVDLAIALLQNQGQPSTPDADIVPLITSIETSNAVLTNLKAKLDAAVTPPQP